MTQTLTLTIQMRRGTTTEWGESIDPLQPGEWALDTTTGTVKLNTTDAAALWGDLDEFAGAPAGPGGAVAFEPLESDDVGGGYFTYTPPADVGDFELVPPEGSHAAFLVVPHVAGDYDFTVALPANADRTLFLFITDSAPFNPEVVGEALGAGPYPDGIVFRIWGDGTIWKHSVLGSEPPPVNSVQVSFGIARDVTDPANPVLRFSTQAILPHATKGIHVGGGTQDGVAGFLVPDPAGQVISGGDYDGQPVWRANPAATTLQGVTLPESGSGVCRLTNQPALVEADMPGYGEGGFDAEDWALWLAGGANNGTHEVFVDSHGVTGLYFVRTIYWNDGIHRDETMQASLPFINDVDATIWLTASPGMASDSVPAAVRAENIVDLTVPGEDVTDPGDIDISALTSGTSNLASVGTLAELITHIDTIS